MLIEILQQEDLAEKEHWDSVYHAAVVGIEAGWKPTDYNALCIEYMLLKEIDDCQPKTVLEVGCGNSMWLSYLARARNLKVSGMDYSEEGCELARRRLKAEDVDGIVYCEDLFEGDPERIGQYDLVYTLGVVEHFSNLEDVLFHLLKYVKPGGTLLTEVPNLLSIHGALAWLYQPKQLAKHKITTRRKLMQAYRNLGLANIRSQNVGTFSLNIVAWGFNQRYPKLDFIIWPIFRRLALFSDSILKRLKVFKGISPVAPFVYISGKKPDSFVNVPNQ